MQKDGAQDYDLTNPNWQRRCPQYLHREGDQRNGQVRVVCQNPKKFILAAILPRSGTFDDGKDLTRRSRPFGWWKRTNARICCNTRHTASIVQGSGRQTERRSLVEISRSNGDFGLSWS